VGHSYPEAGGTEHYCRPADAPGGSHKRPSLVTMASCGALAEAPTDVDFQQKLAFDGFLVTFEAKPLGWNRGEGYKFNEHDYYNPAMQQLKLAAVVVAKSKIR